ncbi:ROK family transcriptional regulator [Isoptericola cucumis]|uniref:Transcriptional regulator n=1 Tax=Isoptericola cucumis TaxID=1776856 RepID=A0ABQ2B3W2_9MICO|nr:ROK family transcriptional regulator [Isoptericola cucumis]GGI04506.1 transcriptional regulator [Isoptericola cucumis]
MALDPAPAEPAAEAPVTSRIVALVSAGVASSRADLARELGVAPSTVSGRVTELIDAGVLDEGGAGESRGGRRPRLLRLRPDGGHVLAADLGGTHARLAVMDLTGRLGAVREVPIEVADGPEAALAAILEEGADLAAPSAASSAASSDAAPGARSALRGIAIGLPGPVDVVTGRVESPARMPGWNGFAVRDWLAERAGVPVLVDNDVNLMALGEHFSYPRRVEHSVTVKAGSGIGSGLIASGRLHRGATGAAGDITHSRVSAAGEIPCSCGKLGCLETIASGAAIVRQLRAQGLDVTTTADVVRRAGDAEPAVTTLVREAGRHLGEVLCTVVNFVNPDAVFLGGALSTLEPFVASVRSQLYEGCHPLVTKNLVITRATTGPEAGVIGAGRLVVQHVLADPGAFLLRD